MEGLRLALSHAVGNLGDAAEFYAEVPDHMRPVSLSQSQWERVMCAVMVCMLTVLLVLGRIFQSMKKNFFSVPRVKEHTINNSA